MTLKRLKLLPIILILFLTACPQPTPPNTPPSASASDLAIAAGRTSGSLDLADLVNDADGDELVYEVTQGANGSVSLTGSVATYTVNVADTTEDSFSYTVSDGTAQTSAVISVSIATGENPGENPGETPDETPENRAPSAEDDDITLALGEDTAELDLSTLVSDPDIIDPETEDELTLSISGEPGEGTVTLDGNTVTYTLENEAAEVDSFEYTVTDSKGETDTGVITVSVEQDDPGNIGAALNDEFRGFNGVTVSAIVTANDDFDGDYTLEYDEEAVYTEDPSITAEVVVEDGLKFNVTPSFSAAIELPATLTFDYTLTNGNESDSATVTLVIEEKPPFIFESGTNYTGNDAPLSAPELVILKGSFGTVTLGENQYLLGGGGDNRVQVDDRTELTYSFSDKEADDRGLGIQRLNVANGNVVGGRMVVREIVGTNLTGDLRLQDMTTRSVTIENSSAKVTLDDVLVVSPLNNAPINLNNIAQLKLSKVKVQNVSANGTGIELKDIGSAQVFNSNISASADGTTGIRMTNTNADDMKLDVSANNVQLAGAGTVAYVVEQLDLGKLSVSGINNKATAETLANVACNVGSLEVEGSPYNCNANRR